ncbi:MAG: inorganic phosphate transporter [Prevotellaceae bacterium]|nr:inorganic phosphate transporter [Prevotellaceae bacterium]
MDIFFLGIVAFLIILALFDLVVGVSNDAVNFLNSAIGAKVARFRTIVAIAAVGVFVGASMSNGMMDVARHGIMTPMHFSFYDVMCVLLAVMVTDVVLLDIFNTLGMPTSTTVSMVFELLGGAFAIALLKIASGAVDAEGRLLSLGDLLNTEKALSVILGIFLSVAIAFVIGTVVQWVARLVFTFTYRVNGKTTDAKGDMGGLASSSVKIGIFSGLAVTSIVWFLLVNGLKGSSLMTQELQAAVNDNAWLIVGGCAVVSSAVMTLLSAFRVPVLKFVVLLGTFALAMAFAGNDLVNFIGVPLTGLEAWQDYMANGGGDSTGYMMTGLMDSASTPMVYLIAAGVMMVLALVFSKKAQNVVKTSVDLSRRDEGDEMFGASAAARVIVRSATRMGTRVAALVPARVRRWVDSRFNADAALLEDGAAFDHIRAAVNLVLAGLLVAIGTSLKLPLSTTYVTFMVAMGASLADRAWSRESAVFRITGVLSVIGGWFITAGAAFIVCYVITNIMYFGKFVAMAIAVVVAITLIIRSNIAYSKKKTKATECDIIFKQLLRETDEKRRWELLCAHVRASCRAHMDFVAATYKDVTDAFLHEDYRRMKRAMHEIEEERKDLKRHRRREIVALRRINPITALERNTWYFMSSNAVEQMIYCIKRINDPCMEHTANNFSPITGEHVTAFLDYRDRILMMYSRGVECLDGGSAEDAAELRADAMVLHASLSAYRRSILDNMHKAQFNIEVMTIHLVMVQESQELLSALRHIVRGMARMQEGGA